MAKSRSPSVWVTSASTQRWAPIGALKPKTVTGVSGFRSGRLRASDRDRVRGWRAARPASVFAEALAAMPKCRATIEWRGRGHYGRTLARVRVRVDGVDLSAGAGRGMFTT